MAEDPQDWEIETRAVRGGMARTPYGEISEALFLTQSFAYPSAEAADRRFPLSQLHDVIDAAFVVPARRRSSK